MRHLTFACLLFAVARLAAAATDGDWTVRVTPFAQVFPALELSQARRHAATAPTDHVLGDGTGLIAVGLRAQHAGERVVLRVAAPGLASGAAYGATLAQAGARYELHPPLDWDTARLVAQTQAQRATLEFTLERDGSTVDTRQVEVMLRPLDEALYYVRDGADSVDLSWIFAAYVDEDGATVDRVLDAALTAGIVERFDGYAAADDDAVYRQVWAVWQALTAHGIRYSGADPAIERGPREYSQRVRTLGETWRDRSANCIDGSVLIASVLQRIGLRSFLVLVPGHAFVGFYTDAEAQRAGFLETTLLGADLPSPAHLPEFARGSQGAQSGLASFTAALAAGRAHHVRVLRKLDGKHRPDYAVIDISAARAFGIRPIEVDAAD